MAVMVEMIENGSSCSSGDHGCTQKGDGQDGAYSYECGEEDTAFLKTL